MGYRLVCLDAGFTLLSPRRTLLDALRGVLAEHGHAPVDEDLARAWHAADAWFWEEYHRPGNDTWTRDAAIEETWRTYHDVMLRELGVEGRRELVERIVAAQLSVDSWELYPDVLPALDAMHARGAGERPLIAVISDWGSSLPEILGAVGLEGRIDIVLASGAEGMAKPDPAFFRLALNRAGVAAGDAVMIGDSYQADVLGARSAGMDAVLLVRAESRTGSPVPESPGVPVIASLAELPALVRRGPMAPR